MMASIPFETILENHMDYLFGDGLKKEISEGKHIKARIFCFGESSVEYQKGSIFYPDNRKPEGATHG